MGQKVGDGRTRRCACGAWRQVRGRFVGRRARCGSDEWHTRGRVHVTVAQMLEQEVGRLDEVLLSLESKNCTAATSQQRPGVVRYRGGRMADQKDVRRNLGRAPMHPGAGGVTAGGAVGTVVGAGEMATCAVVLEEF